MDNFILSELCTVLDISAAKLDLDESFIYNGGHSLSAASLVAKCKARGYFLALRTVLTSPNLSEVISSGHTLPDRSIPISSTEIIHDPPDTSLSLLETTELPRSVPDESHAHVSNLQNEPIHFRPLDRRLKDSTYEDSIGKGQGLQHAYFDTFKAQQAPDTPARTPSGPSSQGKDDPLSRSPSPAPSFSLEDGSLTEMQLLLIHGSMKTPGMNIITHVETFHTKDIPIMKLAWKAVIEQEPIFQVRAFLPVDGKAFNWHVMDSDEECNEGVAYDAHDLGQIGSFFEVVAQEPSPGQEPQSKVIWRVHHALIDGYSASIIFDKVRQVAAGRSVLPGPSFVETVKDFRLLQETRRQEGNAYWTRKYDENSSAKSQLLLPSVDDQPDSEQFQTAGAAISLGVYYERIFSIARASNVTPAVFFNAAWALVLSRYTDSDTVMFGAVLSGRDLPLPDVTDVVGPLVNTLPFFVTVDRESSVKDFLQLVFKNMVELREFQWTIPENGYSRNFESALAVQSGQPEFENLSSRSVGSTHTEQATEIPLSVVIEGDGTLHFQFHRRRFSQQNIDRLSACYYEALQLLSQTHATIGTILEGLMSCPSQALLKQFGNCFSGLTTRTSVKEDLVTLFESSVRKYPGAVAVERGDLRLTYSELDQAASKVALRLEGQIKAGDVVCVHSDRSPNWIVAIYGILKAGGIYCSLASDLPSELRNTMYLSSGAKIYLTPYPAQMELRPDSCDTCWAIESVLTEKVESEKSQFFHRQDSVPWSTAYLCFTSGSTGTPKGVLCTHEGLVAFQSNLQVRLFAQPTTKVSQIMSPAFDGSIHEIFSSLSYGATLVLQSDGDPFGHLSLVDSAILTPSMAQVLDPRDYERLSNVYLVGEPVSQVVCDKWSACKQLYNMYGPTEGTCGATIKRLTVGNAVTVGAPNPTTRIYILDSRQSLVLPGMVGEIYLAGVQVARGYLNLSEQTKDRFLPDSICRNGEYMYKTGDRGYWSEMGEVVCLGRNDRQIKLRGYRLDLNDLEIRVLRAEPRLEAAAVAARGDHLVAMVQPASTDTEELSARIASVLPSYAIMHQIVAVDRLPVTSTGKIDYARVSQMQAEPSKQVSTVPRTATERAISTAFKSILKLEERAPLTTGSDFIKLGGHSLLQLSLASYLTKSFLVRIPLRLIIMNPSLGALAQCIDTFKISTKPILPRGPSLAAQQVAPIEQEWLQKYDIDSGSACFNVCFQCIFGDRVNRSALASAWNTVLARHKLLRSRYKNRRGRAPVRVDADCAPLVERVKDFSLWKEVNRPFHVDCTSPVRVMITRDRLLVVMSHIIADFTALSILLKEASAVYNGQQLGPILRSYPESTVWYDSVAPCYLEFWSTYLENCHENPPLLGRQQERTGYRGTSVVSQIASTIYKGMLAYCKDANLSLQQLVMAAVALCLQLDTLETDIVLGSPYINRNSDEDLDMVGLFLEPLPVRIKYPHPLPKPQSKSDNQEDDQASFLDAVQRSSQSALAHVVPWHQLLRHLAITPNFPNHPLFDVMVTFHDNRQSLGLDMAAPGFESCFLWSEGSKFKLMCEFTAVSEETLVLRLEHDTECVLEKDVAMIQALLPRALELLVQDKTHAEIKESLKESASQVMEHEPLEATDFFGKRLCDF